jgi:hypothetical protein
MADAVLLAATAVIGIGLSLILWRELAAAGDRRRVGPVRDTLEVLLPILATVALLIWAWIA